MPGMIFFFLFRGGFVPKKLFFLSLGEQGSEKKGHHPKQCTFLGGNPSKNLHIFASSLIPPQNGSHLMIPGEGPGWSRPCSLRWFCSLVSPFWLIFHPKPDTNVASLAPENGWHGWNVTIGRLFPFGAFKRLIFRCKLAVSFREGIYIYIWVFPKIVIPPKSSICS